MTFKFQSDKIAKHAELADKIQDKLIIKDSIIQEEVPGTAYEENLPEGLTPDHVKKIASYNGKFVTAAHVAVANIAAGEFERNPSLEEVNATVGYFAKGDSVSINTQKEREFRVPGAEEKYTKKNIVMKTSVNVKSDKGAGLKSLRAEFDQIWKDKK